jgi:hypothetical protein
MPQGSYGGGGGGGGGGLGDSFVDLSVVFQQLLSQAYEELTWEGVKTRLLTAPRPLQKMVAQPRGSSKSKKATIHYHDIGDYLNREEKLKIISQFVSVGFP